MITQQEIIQEKPLKKKEKKMEFNGISAKTQLNHSLLTEL
jgi:hypothetical protein